MNDRAVMGHNQPPDPIDDTLAPFADAIAETDNWLDGIEVKTLGQMEAVDALLADIKRAGVQLDKARLEATKPMRDAVSAENKRFKVYTDDLDRRKKCLAAAVNGYKQKLAAEKAEAKRKAYEEAARLEREAEEAAAKARATDYAAQVEADNAKQAAMYAKNAASAANRDKVTGLRTVHHFEVTDYSVMLRWLNSSDRASLEAFCDEYARQHHRDGIPGVRSWSEMVVK